MGLAEGGGGVACGLVRAEEALARGERPPSFEEYMQVEVRELRKKDAEFDR